jgi:hypothetical protein
MLVVMQGCIEVRFGISFDLIIDLVQATHALVLSHLGVTTSMLSLYIQVFAKQNTKYAGVGR